MHDQSMDIRFLLRFKTEKFFHIHTLLKCDALICSRNALCEVRRFFVLDRRPAGGLLFRWTDRTWSRVSCASSPCLLLWAVQIRRRHGIQRMMDMVRMGADSRTFANQYTLQRGEAAGWLGGANAPPRKIEKLWIDSKLFSPYLHLWPEWI